MGYNPFLSMFIFFLKEILFERKRVSEKEHEQGEGYKQISREPNVRLDPMSLGSWPKPKAVAQPTEPHRHPVTAHFRAKVVPDLAVQCPFKLAPICF